MLREIEHTSPFRDDWGRADFVAHLAERGRLTGYAWALLANHAQLLVRTSNRPLPRILKGSAGCPNHSPQRLCPQ